MMHVAIRFDDPSAQSNHALERKIIEILEKHQACATFAVIPAIDAQPLSPHVVSHLREAASNGTIEVVQHGYRHCDHQVGSGSPTEFSGIPSDLQRSWISDGRRILEDVFGQHIAGFVPPFNDFDQNTASVLSELDFSYLSAGWEKEIPADSKFALVPRTCQATELRQAVEEGRSRGDKQFAVIAVLHHYDFVECGQASAPLSLASFDELLGWLAAQKHVQLATLGELVSQYSAQTWRAATLRRQRLARLYWRIQRFLPQYGLVFRPLWANIRIPERTLHD